MAQIILAIQSGSLKNITDQTNVIIAWNNIKIFNLHISKYLWASKKNPLDNIHQNNIVKVTYHQNSKDTNSIFQYIKNVNIHKNIEINQVLTYQNTPQSIFFQYFFITKLCRAYKNLTNKIIKNAL